MSFANLICAAPMRWIARRDMERLEAFYALFSAILTRTQPTAAAALAAHDIEPRLFMLPWLLTLFSKPLGLEVGVRLWDRCLLGGISEIVRCAVALVAHMQPVLTASTATMEGSLKALGSIPTTMRSGSAITAIADAIRLTPAEEAVLRRMQL